MTDCAWLQYAENQVSYMVADGDFKYVLYDHGSGMEQLYDMVSSQATCRCLLFPGALLTDCLCLQVGDPGETRNHAAEHPEKLEAMRGVLQREKGAHMALALQPVA